MNKQKICGLLIFLISPLIGVVLLELFLRKELQLTFTWIMGNIGIFIISTLIFFVIECFLLSIINNYYFSILLSYAFFFTFAVINYYKLNIINEPLLPWDLYFFNQVVDLLPVLYNNLNIAFAIFSLLIIAILTYLILKYAKVSVLKWKGKLSILVISLIILTMFINYPKNFINTFVTKSGASLISWDQKTNQINNGFIVGFLINIPSLYIKEPKNYTYENVMNYINEINYSSNNTYEISGKNPNIVVIMSEAFWELKNLGLNSINPTVDRFKIGNIVSPTFGGGTANVEFEVLTGFSMNHLPGGSIPYQQYISKDIPSLATVLKEKGYNATAIHTYYKYFWNRDEVYQHLGFEKFIGLDDLKNPKYYGDYYVDDYEINSLILDEIKKKMKSLLLYTL
jgi:phosphoglycerol transferase MdoB-like AlkP superfamily enzyme